MLSKILSQITLCLILSSFSFNTVFATAPAPAACINDPLVRPFFNWTESVNTKGDEYCKKITCLQKRIDEPATTDQIAKGYRGNGISDDRCQNLQCKDENGVVQAGKYYKSITERNADSDKDCEINGGNETCNAVNLPKKIGKCESCKQALNLAQNTPISSDFSASIQVGNQTIDVNRDNLQEECGEFRNVTNCARSYSCIEDANEPTAIASVETSGEDYQRTPFGTEFFDVTDTQKGLRQEGQGLNNFNTNIEGGPIIGTINTVANFLVRMISVFALVIFIVGAFLLITANGDENRINQGKDALKYSLLGIVIVMFSYTIVILVQSIFF